ncbi:MAG: sulfatase-like hydrolase/transferase, partial [Fibrobacteres bacterium]|nr:sulfatase-like hydrolase/transferase [Fibrobacterota bacterium]
MINVKKIVDWRKLLSFSAAGLTVASLTDSVVGASNSVEPLKPNIIIIQTDDQGYNDLSCYGSKNIRTPHIDSMALNGVKFTDYYCPAPVCSPSRAGLLTGTYPARLGFGGLALYPGIPQGLNPNEVTIAEMLKTMGYTTACVGKWHVGGNKMTTQDKDLLVYHPLRNGFDSFYGFYSNGTWVTPLVREYTEVGPTDSSKITNQLTVEAVS